MAIRPNRTISAPPPGHCADHGAELRSGRACCDTARAVRESAARLAARTPDERAAAVAIYRSLFGTDED